MTTLHTEALAGLERYAQQSEFELTVLARPAERCIQATTLAELVRLARLGLLAEESPTVVFHGEAQLARAWETAGQPLPANGERILLVRMP